MKHRLNATVIVLVMMGILLPLTLATNRVYKLRTPVRDETLRELQEKNPLSFTNGDLGPIIDAAEEAAAAEDAENGGTPPGDGGDENYSIGCNTGGNTVMYLYFQYEMETSASQDKDTVQEELEAALNQALANRLLYCPGTEYDGEETGIVELSSLGKDNVTESACDPDNIVDAANKCEVLEGEMSVWFMPEYSRDAVEYSIMTDIRDYLNRAPEVNGVVRTLYLGPAINNPSGIEDGDTPSNVTPGGASDGLNNRSIIFMSLASVGFVAAVGMVTYFRLRKRAREEDVPYVATLENNSSGEESPSRMSSSCDDSHISSIMPSNYRLDVSESPFSSIIQPSLGPSSMGTIQESDSDGPASDIIVSSDGYSTEDSSIAELSYFGNNYMKQISPVLGARPRTVSVTVFCVSTRTVLKHVLTNRLLFHQLFLRQQDDEIEESLDSNTTF